MEPGSACFWQAMGGKKATGRNWYTGRFPDYEEEFLYCVGGQALAQAAQRGLGVSLTGDTWELPGHNPVPWTLSRDVGGWSRWSSVVPFNLTYSVTLSVSPLAAEHMVVPVISPPAPTAAQPVRSELGMSWAQSWLCAIILGHTTTPEDNVPVGQTIAGRKCLSLDAFIYTQDGIRRGRPRADTVRDLISEGEHSSSRIRCNICNRVFPREKSLQAHKRTHTGE